MATRPLRVAIVHDWLYGGGAELVVEQLHKLYPDAPIYTSYCSKDWRRRLDNKVKTGYLQHWPFSKLRKFLPILRILWFSGLSFKNYDLVISSSGAEAKGIKVPRRVLHINYCHAPTHYYWSRYNQYLRNPGFGNFNGLARIGLKLLVAPLRRWDRKAAQRADYMIANSTHIQAEIKKYYKRDAVVIFPPVNVDRFKKNITIDSQRTGFVIAGRQTPYKRFDLAVKTCSKLDIPLTVIGSGPDNARLRKLGEHSVTFLGNVSDEIIVEEFGRAKALIFPGLDDFGITPVEAMAAGTPVVAFKAGGALDYVIDGKTGIFFEKQTIKSLAGALGKVDKMYPEHRFIKQFAANFSAERFQAAMVEFIAKALKSKQA